jgi:pimeloyl-ACP methyl ester carboxylesterase
MLIVSVDGRAERVVLKDGFELVGEVHSAEGHVVVRTPLAWYTFASEQLLRVEPPLPGEIPPEVYLLPAGARKAQRKIEPLSGVEILEPFDSFGRRRVRIRWGDGKELEVVQAVTEIHPTHVRVEGLGIEWSSSLSISEVGSDELLAMLEQQSPPDQLENGLKLIHFLIQARQFTIARDRLTKIRQRFPQESARLDPLETEWTQALFQEGQRRVTRLRGDQRWEEARRVTQELASKAPAEQRAVWEGWLEQQARTDRDLRRAKELVEQASKDRRDPLERELGDEILRELGPGTLERLTPLLGVGEDPSLTPDQRWALAASGWVAGPKLARDDLPSARRWITRRKLVDQTFHAPSEEDFEIALDSLRGEQVPADQVAQILQWLPAPVSPLAPGEEADQTVEGMAPRSSRYRVWLPAEYHRFQKHPLLVVLHDAPSTPAEAIRFWKNLAADLNAVLVAPEYLLDATQAYTYSLAEHEAFLAMLADVRRRFGVDSARVFLAGHGIGGSAAFDLGWSHPDDWAGVIPIGAAPLFYMQYYWKNARHLPTYIIDGQWAGSNAAVTRSLVQQNFRRGDPVMQVVQFGRGPGRFGSELPRLGDWMARQRRPLFPPSIEATSARHSDRQFYWARIDSFLSKSTIAPTLFDKKKGLRPARLEGVVEQGRTLSIQSSGMDGLSLLLSPALAPIHDADFEIRYQRKVVHQGAIESDIATMIGEARRTGDRERLIHRIWPIK